MNNLEKNYGETNFITGMRAYAALAVVLIHSGGAGLRELGLLGNFLADLGRTGVYVFFVISGYSVSVSYSKSQAYSIYLVRRLFRLAPIYYFWLLVVAFLMGSENPDFYNIAMHMLFISFLDYKIANSVLSVEWSIAIEVFWYLCIPGLVIFAKGINRALILVVMSLLFYILLHKNPWLIPSIVAVDQKDVYLAMHYSPFPYLFSFCLGVLHSLLEFIILI